MSMRRRDLGLVVIGLIAGAGLLAGLGVARPEPEKEPRWEYAEMVIDNGQAVLISDRTTQTVDIPLQPADQTITYRNEVGSFKRKFQPLLYTMNVFGRDGWEIVSDAPLREGDRVLVRRQR